MDIESILEEYSLTDFAVGSGGCWNDAPMECCERDITVFDGRDESDLVTEQDGTIIRIHHGSLNEHHSSVLVQFCDLTILRDERWEIRTFMSKLRERRDILFHDSTRDALLDAMFCTTRARTGLASNDVLAPIWLKCAAFYLADAICLLHGKRPSPAHMLGILRGLEDSSTNEALELIHSCVGTRRATPTLLDRMARSAIGFSDLTEGNDHSRIIARKHEYMTGNRYLADCHFYLGYVCRNIMIMAGDAVQSRPGLGHILKTAMDIEGSTAEHVERCGSLRNAASDILSRTT